MLLIGLPQGGVSLATGWVGGFGGRQGVTVAIGGVGGVKSSQKW